MGFFKTDDDENEGNNEDMYVTTGIQMFRSVNTINNCIPTLSAA